MSRKNSSRNEEIGRRMKENYEDVAKTRLIRRMPVVIRVDGRAFHTFTRGFDRPFDDILIKSMQETMRQLCMHVQGCVFGYTQSDEISLLLIDYNELDSSSWFDYEVEKLCSITASMATLYFNRAFAKFVEKEKESEFKKKHLAAVEKGAMFDSRCFNIPKEEVCNYFYWRQIDAERNSIQMVARTKYSHKELLNINTGLIKEKLREEKGIRFDSYPVFQRRGSCCFAKEWCDQGILKHDWQIDPCIPKFKGEDRNYIERFVYIDPAEKIEV